MQTNGFGVVKNPHRIQNLLEVDSVTDKAKKNKHFLAISYI